MKVVVQLTKLFLFIQPTQASKQSSGQALSTPAIVMIAVGGYMTVVIVTLIIRQCLKVRIKSYKFTLHSVVVMEIHCKLARE